ncbi:MAG TPA: PhnD/SsuA/transferrin family substrate-binding protein [Holophagaceae bacterium]|nr:PhnD/SsuA/transferrin family substrate-binding protein [Holophagaceae bacterium]
MGHLKAALLFLLLALPALPQAPLRIGMLAFRPKAKVAAEWEPMGRHLGAALGRPVTVTPYDFQDLNAAITRNEVDVVITNPGHYILLKQRNVMSAPLVTKVDREGEHRLSAFGGVIFTRFDHPEIQGLADLAGKRIAAVGKESLGGFQMEAFEMLEAGVPLPDQDHLVAMGLPHDRSVEAVLSGKADAGFVRSGVLEAMAREGKLDLKAIRIINRQELSSFPYAVSTRLHPEWPVAVFPQVESALADQLAIALLSIRPESEAARAAGLYGFTTPSDYSGVEQMLRRLRLPPFEAAPQITLTDLWNRYAPWISVLGGLVLVLGVMTVGLVLQNRQIQQSEARSSIILNNLDAYIYLKDPGGRYLFANQRVLDLWGGIPLEDVLHQGDAAFFEPETVAKIQAIDREVLEGGKTVRAEETNTIKGTDRTTTYWSIKMPLRRADGSIYALCGISTDITARKRAEEAMSYLAAIVESSDDAIVSISLEGTITSWNQAAVRMFGYTVAEAVGQSVQMLIPSDRRAEDAQIQERVLTGESVRQFETVRLRKDGHPLDVSITLSPIRNATGIILGASKVIRDITEIRKAEELHRKWEADLQQAQKLESLGSLAGGIAHDMNNVLAAIQAITQTLKFTHAADETLVGSLDTIEKASTRGRDLVKGLTNFARKDLREPERLDLNALVEDEMDILRRTTLQKVRLTLDLDAARPQVHGERSTLASAIMNLCVNAVDAMPEGGTLTLRTRCLPPGEVAFSVEDSGQGMTPEVLARAMEPFYTTKPVGKGTGLGLAMVYTTAKAHGGSVEITSEPGKGTCVTLRLPTVLPSDDSAEVVEVEAPSSAGLRILQVDDDELILDSVPAMIEALGHRIDTAMGGAEALDLFAKGLKVDLVILDLNMPGMNGEETLREIRKVHPDLPVLLATGFLDARTEAILKGDARVRSISKPFSMKELDAKIKEMDALRR